MNNITFNQWLNEETDTEFCDKRLDDRFKKIVQQLWNNLGQPIPYACQDWANTKAAYRFLSNNKVTEDKIFKGHFESTRQRVMADNDGWILVIQDTTEFSYNRKESGKIGWTKLFNSNNSLYKKCGILMHSSLAITSKGLPLGLCAIKFWSRKNFKGTKKELKTKINPMRIPINQKESIRWLENLEATTSLFNNDKRCVHVGDRESDIYELLCLANQVNTNFLIRSCHDRIIDGEHHKIQAKMDSVSIAGTHTIRLENSKDKKDRDVKLNIKFQRLNFLVPIDKKKNCTLVI